MSWKGIGRLFFAFMAAASMYVGKANAQDLNDTRIAFTSARTGNREIYVMNTDGSNPVQITNNPANDYEPSWSPDGKKIAFTSNRTGNHEIYVMNADGSNPVNITNNLAADWCPSWSPDGNKIAFTSDRTGNHEIYVMNSDGTNPKRLTNSPADDDYQPSWSPDGNKIAFASGRATWTDIFVMNADGSNPVNITNDNRVGDYDPSWSPDGNKIAFTLNEEQNPNRMVRYEIYVMNADGSDQTNITNEARDDMYPSWSPFLTPTNTPPTINYIGQTTATVGKPLEGRLDIKDPDGDKVTVSFENLPSWLKYDATTGLLSGTPITDGKYTAVIIVNDGTNTTTKTLDFIITQPTNRPPTLTGFTGATTADEGNLIKLLLQTSDADGDTVTIAIPNKPSGMQLENDNIIWTPRYNQSGTYKILVELSDGKQTTTQTLEIKINNYVGIAGKVLDIDGNPLPSRIDILTGISAETDSDGNFWIPGTIPNEIRFKKFNDGNLELKIQPKGWGKFGIAYLRYTQNILGDEGVIQPTIFISPYALWSDPTKQVQTCALYLPLEIKPTNKPLIFIPGVANKHNELGLIENLETQNPGNIDIFQLYYPNNQKIQLSSGLIIPIKDWILSRYQKNTKAIVVTHSMGGLVYRAAETGLAILGEEKLPQIQGIETAILIQPPNYGSEMARIIENGEIFNPTAFINALMGHTLGAPAYIDMSPQSKFLRELNQREVRKDISHLVIGGYQARTIGNILHTESPIGDLVVDLSRASLLKLGVPLIAEPGDHGDGVGFMAEKPEIAQQNATMIYDIINQRAIKLSSGTVLLRPEDDITQKLKSAGLDKLVRFALNVTFFDQNKAPADFPNLYLHSVDGKKIIPPVILSRNKETGAYYYFDGQLATFPGMALESGVSYEIRNGLLNSSPLIARFSHNNPLVVNNLDIYSVPNTKTSIVDANTGLDIGVPENAFESGQAFINVTVLPSQSAEDKGNIAGIIYQISPSSPLKQGQSLRVTFPKPDGMDLSKLEEIAVYTRHSPREKWEVVPGPYQVTANGITANINQFSEFAVGRKPVQQLLGDVNSDGVVNIVDLVLVAQKFGQSIKGPADVNSDGSVNIVDLVLVAKNFGQSVLAAPSNDYRNVKVRKSDLLTLDNSIHNLERRMFIPEYQSSWNAESRNERDNINYAIDTLRQIIKANIALDEDLVTRILPVYPNPFNPETWIPFELKDESKVYVEIYNVAGDFVRGINLGNVQAGKYIGRDSAIYWDGKNNLGEQVASGAYFYRFFASPANNVPFFATGKMMVGK